MNFDGPDGRDYDNVVSLNHAWLRLQRKEPAFRRMLNGNSETFARQLADLTPRQVERLAATPMLLFSLRERDEEFWTRILDTSMTRDLFSRSLSHDADLLVSAALGFVWQLARRNPYTLRLVCGATMYWCERIAELTLYQLLAAVRRSGEIPLPRLSNNIPVWQKLLNAGTAGNRNVRSAAQFAALQTLLTESQPLTRGSALPRAARRMNAPGFRVAE